MRHYTNITQQQEEKHSKDSSPYGKRRKKAIRRKPTSLLVPHGTFQIWLDHPRELLELHDTPAVQDQARAERLQDARGGSPGQSRGIAWNFGTDATPHITSEPQLRALLLDGWPQGATEARALAAQIESNLPDPKTFRRLFRWDEFEGEEASFERAQVGLAPWRGTYRNWRTGCGIVEIVAPWGDACRSDYEIIKWSGAALLAFADILDRADLRMEIVLLNVAYSQHSQQEILVTRLQLKEASDPLDAEQIAAVVSHPGIWRTYGLAGYELAPWYMGPARSHSHMALHKQFTWSHYAGEGIEPIETVATEVTQGLYGNPRALTVVMKMAGSEHQAVRRVGEALADLVKLLGLKGEE